MSFEWQTDEDWGQTLEPPPPSPPGNRRKWIVAALIMAIGGLGAWLVWGRLSNQVDNAVADEEAGVIAGINLIRDAVQREDVELFVSNLSGRDDEWAEEQQHMLAAGVLYDRSPLGLAWQPHGTQVVSMTLSPDLLTADVTMAESYQIDLGNGVTDTVHLTQQEIYRRGETRWLLAPPSQPTSETPTIQRANGLFTLIAPDDQATEITDRFWNEMMEMGERYCLLPDIECPSNLHLTILFSDDWRTLEAESDNETYAFRRGRELVLPAPNLVGMPANEKAYQALWRAYGAKIFNVLIARSVGYECCSRYPLYQAVADAILANMALIPPPLTHTDYLAALNAGALARDLQSLWDFAEANPTTVRNREAAILISFMLAHSAHATPGNILPAFVAANGFWEWAGAFIDIEAERLDTNWSRFLAEGAAAGIPSSARPLPNQTLLGICEKDGSSSLLAYQPASGIWQPLQQFDAAPVDLVPLPNGDGALLINRPLGAEPARLDWYRPDGEVTPVTLPGEMGSGFFTVDAGNSPQNIVISNRQGLTDYIALLDLTACAVDSCSARLLPFNSAPVFAPDNNHALWREAAGNAQRDSAADPIHLLDQDLQPLGIVRQGMQSLYWLSVDRYGYRLDRDTFVNATIDGDVQPLFTTDSLLASLDELGSGVPTTLSVTPIPHQTHHILINLHLFLSEQSTNRYLLILYDMGQNNARLLHQSELSMGAIRFSQNREWIAIRAFSEISIQRELMLLNLQNGEVRAYGNTGLSNEVAWSSDGEWLAHSGAGFVSLHLPASNYQQILLPDIGECRQLAWR